MTGTGAMATRARVPAVLGHLDALPGAPTRHDLDADHGRAEHLAGRGLSWFPLTGPISMMIRLGTGEVAAWDVLIALGCLAAGVYLAIRAAAALLRLGLLMHGKRPTLSEIARQLRRA